MLSGVCKRSVRSLLSTAKVARTFASKNQGDNGVSPTISDEQNKEQASDSQSQTDNRQSQKQFKNKGQNSVKQNNQGTQNQSSQQQKNQQQSDQKTQQNAPKQGNFLFASAKKVADVMHSTNVDQPTQQAKMAEGNPNKRTDNFSQQENRNQSMTINQEGQRNNDFNRNKNQRHAIQNDFKKKENEKHTIHTASKLFAPPQPRVDTKQDSSEKFNFNKKDRPQYTNDKPDRNETEQQEIKRPHKLFQPLGGNNQRDQSIADKSEIGTSRNQTRFNTGNRPLNNLDDQQELPSIRNDRHRKLNNATQAQFAGNVNEPIMSLDEVENEDEYDEEMDDEMDEEDMEEILENANIDVEDFGPTPES